MDENREEKIKVDAGTVTRTIVLFLTIINAILAITGKDKIKFTENDIYQCVSAILTVIVPLINWWENNAFTKNARKAEKYRKNLDKKDREDNSDNA